MHCQCFNHKNYGDWKLQGACSENLHYLWKRAVRFAGKPCDNYRSCNYHGVSPQFLQPFSMDRAGFPCRDPEIPSPHTFHGIKICSVCKNVVFLLSCPTFKWCKKIYIVEDRFCRNHWKWKRYIHTYFLCSHIYEQDQPQICQCDTISWLNFID